MGINHSAIITTLNAMAGTAGKIIHFADGIYDISVNYYDLIREKAKFQMSLNKRKVGEFSGTMEDFLGHDPSVHLDGSSATRVTFRGVSVERGNKFMILGTPDRIENAPLDYVSFIPRRTFDRDMEL